MAPSVTTAELERALTGELVRPAEPGWDEARRPWNVAVDQRPELVVSPRSAHDVATAVRYAGEHGLRVAAQGTGHGAQARGPVDGALLLNTSALREVEVDAASRTARVGAGVLWGELAQAAARDGLAGLAGSAAVVGVAGYVLGGGIGWLARRYGLASNSVRAFEAVTAAGEVVRADRENEPELFWALRGGGGSFAVVTAVELDLLPIEEVYAGSLFWPVERTAEVLEAYAAWVAGLPDELTSTVQVVHVPVLPFVPEEVRGKSFALVTAAHLGGRDEGDALLQPLRDLAPVMDTMTVMPPPGLAAIHGDPEEPLPAHGDHALVAELPRAAIDAVVELHATPGTSPLIAVELRHLEGALARAPEGAGALATLEGRFAAFAVGVTATPEQAKAVTSHLEAVVDALRPWSLPRSFPNFVDRPDDQRPAFDPETLARLRRARAQYDPGALFLAANEVPPAE